jgi:hypothetical protein
MKLRRRILVTLAAALSLLVVAGCTTTRLSVNRVDQNPVSGQVYYLPQAEFAVDVERELRKCAVAADDPATMNAWLNEQVTVVERASQSLRDARMTVSTSRASGTPLQCTDAMLGLHPTTLAAVRAAGIDPDPCAHEDAAGIHNQALDALLRRIADDPGIKDTPIERDLLGLRASAGASGAEFLKAITTWLEDRRGQPIQIELRIDLRASVRAHFLPDQSHAYAIDYTASRNALKKTGYEIETYPVGTLKGVNIKLDDESGAVIQAALNGAISLLSARLGAPGTAAAPHAVQQLPTQSYADFVKAQQDAPAHLCTREIRELLAQREEHEKLVRALKAAMSSDTGRHERARDRLAVTRQALLRAEAAGSADEVLRLGQAIEEAQADAEAAEEALKATAKRLEQAQSRLAAARDRLTVKGYAHFVPDRHSRSAEVRDGRAALERWFDSEALRTWCERAERCSDDLPVETRVWAAVHVPSSPPTRNRDTDSPTSPGDDRGGIVYRQPARGLLLVCKGTPCLNEMGAIVAGQAATLHLGEVDVPQLGVLARLPLVNAAFQNNALEASFSESGALTRVKYDSNARAAAASKTFSDSADSLKDYAEARRGRAEARVKAEASRTRAETELLEAQLARARALRALEAFRNGEAEPDDGGGE